MTLTDKDSYSIGALVLDSSCFISFFGLSIINKVSCLYTVPNVLTEIKDKSSCQTLSLWKEKIIIRMPKPFYIEKIITFSKKTGDYEVLSITDIHLLALTYELECEINDNSFESYKELDKSKIEETSKKEDINTAINEKDLSDISILKDSFEEEHKNENLTNNVHQLANDLENMNFKDMDDDDGWITPSNIHYYKSLNKRSGTIPMKKAEYIKVACVTNDFAIQNILLQMDLNLVSPENGLKIKTVKSWVLRCYACFKIVKDMSKRFCPGCGGNTLLRTSCSMNSNGKFRIYLKRHMQWNNRGTIYPIPKPQHGSASGKGYKPIILREDQKEYQKAVKYQKRKKEINLLDPDKLPDILTGKRNTSCHKVVIGMGRRNPNEKVKSR
ncbi:hypothetical protein T552_01010 [Pneumocystis carinii B80]|uniref:20S-pre-rRNA D-site endonuclease NOB1 n=1 Tax=Pneumocystis carinii (strain B80) TaxID=1408658 RepID=A0A0W4ZN54_PNEC8|nr:hypothetical protein T552_01010 [Pneumocystis carinii B80]KTW29805.1 hypothetical protein T552_01010 [Pneumocystis carinii B80]